MEIKYIVYEVTLNSLEAEMHYKMDGIPISAISRDYRYHDPCNVYRIVRYPTLPSKVKVMVMGGKKAMPCPTH